MIVRISGTGQFELDDKAVHRLDELDTRLTSAMNDQDQDRFHEVLAEIIRFVESSGKRTPDDVVVPSEVIVPPEDITLVEAHQFLTDEGLMQPLPA